MPQIRETAPQEQAANGGASPVTETRVDAAHSIGDAVSAPLLADLTLAQMPLGDAPLADIPLADIAIEQAISELVRAEGSVQVRAQADQLAAHLRERQRQLDHREAQVNARVAAFEQEIRDARAWLVQRNDELNERESRIESREAAATAPASPASKPATEVDPLLALAKSSQSPEIPATRPPDEGGGLPDQGNEPRKAATEESSFYGFYDTAPFGTAASAEVQAPFDEPAGFEEPLALDWPLSDTEWQQRKRALTLASQQVDRRRQALQELHEEISQMHDEALELQLVTRELQAQLRPALGGDAAGEALRAARDKVARRYTKEAAQLTRQRKELEKLRSDLANEHAKLQRRYQEFRGWIESQRECLAADDSRGARSVV